MDTTIEKSIHEKKQNKKASTAVANSQKEVIAVEVIQPEVRNLKMYKDTFGSLATFKCNRIGFPIYVLSGEPEAGSVRDRTLSTAQLTVGVSRHWD